MRKKNWLRRGMSPADFADLVFVTHAPPIEVYRWYESLEKDPEWFLGETQVVKSQVLADYLAYRRNDPLIDLALARYGFSQIVSKRLYRRLPHAGRVALCANIALYCGIQGRNVHLEGEDLKTEVLHHGSDDEVRALCTVELMDCYRYSELLECWPPKRSVEGSKLDDRRYELVLRSLAKNPRLHALHEWTIRDAGNFRVHENEFECFETAWRLAERLPAEERWANVLMVLFEDLGCSPSAEIDVAALVKRWRPANGADDTMAFRAVRSSILALNGSPSERWYDHEDPAYRLAALQSMDITFLYSASRIEKLGLDIFEAFRAISLNREQLKTVGLDSILKDLIEFIDENKRWRVWNYYEKARRKFANAE